jgi:hypothetical protein
MKELTSQQTKEFQRYARAHLPGRSDWSGFHPVIRRVWWELACEYDGMDPDGAFVVFSRDNPWFQNEPTKTRYAVVAVEATVDYLTANDEESETDGWREAEDRLVEYLRGFNRFRDQAAPTVKFIKWGEEYDGA